MKYFSQAAQIARKFFAVASLLTAVLLSGCATIVKGSGDSLHVETPSCREKISCKASNRKGTWDFTAPGSVRFGKSEEALTITCQDGPDALVRLIYSEPGGWILANLLLPIIGFPIGMLVDLASDAHHSMVDSVTLHRGYCRGKKISD